MIIKFIKYLFVSLIFTLWTMGCAQISSPQGGPIDSLAPIVLSTNPVQRTTNFKGKRITITFNEFVVLKDQQKFFVVSPPGKQKPLLTIKGKNIVVDFEEPLDSATTYRLDFGSSIVDNNEGNQLRDFSYIFSTGDVIDSLMMVGQVVDAHSRDSIVGALMYYYDARADSVKLDSTLFNAKVDALFRTDSSGYFVADILKDKKYRIYAVADNNGNQTYDAGVDLVGFVSDSFNPVDLDGFTVVYDSLTNRTMIEGLQAHFEVFKEAAVKKQVLLKHSRPMRQRLTFEFNSPGAIIDTLELTGIDSSWIIRESNRLGDSVSLWISPPTKADLDSLADTIRGRVVYQRHDSIWNYYPYSQPLTFAYKHPTVSKESKKAKEKAEQKVKDWEEDRQKRIANGDSTAVNDTLPVEKVPNPFKFSVSASATLNPTQNISFTFDYPLRLVDSANIELIHMVKEQKKGRAKKDVETVTTPEKVKVKLEIDSTDMRRWILSSTWVNDDDYKLTIPAGVFGDISLLANDTLKSSFRIASPDKFGSFTIKTEQDNTLDSLSYIFELLSGRGTSERVVMRKIGVKAGETVKMEFIQPGNFRLRIIEDKNHNNRWDTGALTNRIQPEKSRVWTHESTGSPILISKENWEVEVPTDLRKIFNSR